MIKVKIVKENSNYQKISILGHAMYDDYGKDIVCAGVSAVVTGGINALESEIENIKIINEWYNKNKF